MFEKDDIVMFLRVQQGCNLNCSHCFTMGNRDPIATTDFTYVDKFLSAISKNVNPKRGVVYLHGGETFLAPMSYLKQVTARVKELFGSRVSIIPQTNLIYTIDDEYIDFIKNHCSNHVGVSWDAGIRFGSIKTEHAYKQEKMFFENMQTLIKAGVNVHVSITVQNNLLTYSPAQIARMFAGANSIDFEHLSVFNDTTESLRCNLQEWAHWLDCLVEIYQTQTVSWSMPLVDMFAEAIDTGRTYTCKCNCCDRRTFTLNPNGTTGFCPDDSYYNPTGDVEIMTEDWHRFEELAHTAHIGRLSTLNTENCFACEHYNECGGNCEDTLFDGSGECPLSKKVIARIKSNTEVFLQLLKERAQNNLLEFIVGKKS